MKHIKKIDQWLNEKLVSAASNHNYYTLKADCPVKYIESQSNPTGAKGVLLHNKEGYLDGQQGCYIIDYSGGHYYVDLDNQFASYIYKIKDQDRGFRDCLKPVNKAPEFSDWKDWLRKIPMR